MRTPLKNMLGVGLIEVLVTMLLLSTALLTFASLQTRSLQYNQGAYFRSQANILAYDMLDRIRANKGDLANYSLALSSFSAGASAGAGISGNDIFLWRRSVDTRLPSARAAITCVVATRLCTVTVEWGEFTNADSRDDTSTFTFTSRIPN